MGTGIIANLKNLAPLSLYMFAVFCCLMALVGRTRWAILLVVLLSPLRNVVEKMAPMPLGSQLLDILFVSMLFGWVGSSVFLREKFIEQSRLNAIAIILIFYTAISVGLGNSYLFGEFGFDIGDPRVQAAKNFCLLPMLFFLVLNGIKDKVWVWRTFFVMCFAMFLMDYYTSSQIVQYSSLVSRKKISGTFQFLGPNEVAAFYNVNCMVMLGVYFFMKKSWKKVALLALIVFNFYCMLFMYSRAAYGATAIGLFLLFAFKNKKLLIPLFLIIIFWQIALPEKARERIQSTRNEFGELDQSTARRLNIWDEAIRIFQENPLTGIGYGSFSSLRLNLGDTHNIYIKIAAEQGIVGLTIFGVLIFSFMREGYHLYRNGKDDESKGLGLGFAVAVVVVLANNLFGNRWSYYEMSAYLWVYAGLVARLNALSQPPPESMSLPDPKFANSFKQSRQKQSKKKTGSRFERSV